MHPEKQRLSTILSQFVPAASVEQCRQLSGGHINSTFRVDAVLAEGRREKYLLQKINTGIFREPEWVMENIAATARHLSNKDYHLKVMSPMRTTSGAWLFFQEGEAWRLFPFFDNAVGYLETDNDERAHATARAFGHFLSRLSDFDAKKLHLTLPDFHNGNLRTKQLRAAVRNAGADRLGQAKALLKEIQEHLAILEKVESVPLPVRVVHHDAKISNVLFDEKTNQPVAIIDLDTIMPGRILSDFGDLVRSLACTASEEEEDSSKIAFLPARYAALEAGFLEGLSGDIATKEKKALPTAGPWLTLMQAVRFLTDYLNGDVYYRVNHGLQNYYRARNQFVLYKSMKDQLADRLIVC